MLRTFNYTGRKRITHDRVSFTVKEGDEYDRFVADVDLDDLELPLDAKVYVEAYYRDTFMRFDFGEVANLSPPPNSELTDFEGSGGVSFRVRVVDESGRRGRILALADSVQPTNRGKEDSEASRIRPILPVNIKDMGQETWNLNMGDSGDPQPVLDVNKNISPLIAELIHQDAYFVANIFPEVVRKILTHILLIERIESADEEDLDGWKRDWMIFTKRYCGSQPVTYNPQDDNIADVINWIDETVRAFCRKHRVLTRLRTRVEDED